MQRKKGKKKVVIKTERGKTVPNEGKENDKRKKKIGRLSQECTKTKLVKQKRSNEKDKESNGRRSQALKNKFWNERKLVGLTP